MKALCLISCFILSSVGCTTGSQSKPIKPSFSLFDYGGKLTKTGPKNNTISPPITRSNFKGLALWQGSYLAGKGEDLEIFSDGKIVWKETHSPKPFDSQTQKGQLSEADFNKLIEILNQSKVWEFHSHYSTDIFDGGFAQLVITTTDGDLSVGFSNHYDPIQDLIKFLNKRELNK